MRGMCLCLAVLVSIAGAAPAKEKTLHSFANAGEGSYPYGGLARDAAGNFYGTTFLGGSTGNGVVFELVRDKAWSEQVLYSFTGGADGGWPVTRLLFDAAGDLYGTTQDGGRFGGGTVFELTPSTAGWMEKVLWDFDVRNGNAPFGDLIFDGNGYLYGTTQLGGGTCDCGVAYELSPTQKHKWNLTILHRFKGGNDGASPIGGLVMDSTGNLYGTAYQAGPNGSGAVFELSPSGTKWKERVLFGFAKDGRNGAYPAAPLTFGQDGNLYGAASSGGTHYAGVIFEIDPATGAESTIYSFTDGSDQGAPVGGVSFDDKGNLFGTTVGISSYGTVFQLTPSQNGSWNETTLYAFTGQADGDTPESAVLVDNKGHLFGAASGVQGYSGGAVYKIWVP